MLYNSEGNKVDLPVGNVGLGWSITGGQIYRVANGMIDEVYTFNEYMDRTANTNWDQESNLNKYYNPFIYNEDYLHEPDLDEFIINIGKINASFFMYNAFTAPPAHRKYSGSFHKDKQESHRKIVRTLR